MSDVTIIMQNSLTTFFWSSQICNNIKGGGGVIFFSTHAKNFGQIKSPIIWGGGGGGIKSR